MADLIAAKRSRRDGCRTRSASSRDNTVIITNEGDICEPNSQQSRQGCRIAGRGRRRIGGRRHARRRRPARHRPGGAATGLITIAPVALATPSSRPRRPPAFVVPAFVTTGGILDRASSTAAFSNVGSPKVYLGRMTNQLNASDVMSSCRNILGFKLGETTIQAGSISVIGLPNIPLLRNPAPNTKILLPGYYDHAEPADGSGRRPHGDRDLRHQLPADPVDRGQPLLIVAVTAGAPAPAGALSRDPALSAPLWPETLRKLRPTRAMTLSYRSTTKSKFRRSRVSGGGRPMNRMIRGAARLAGPLALLAGILTAARRPPRRARRSTSPTR